jgi:hypothetical protein
MVQIELTDVALFKSFVEIEQGGIYVDLHNDFKCKGMKYSHPKRELVVSFEVIKKSPIQCVDVVFQGVTIEQINLETEDPNVDMWIIDNMYRGRFERQQGILEEISSEGDYYYYVTFEGDYSVELFANRVFAQISLSN